MSAPPAGASAPPWKDAIKLAAYSPFSTGSSPGVSCPRPQRGSRKMFMLGDQNVRPLVTPMLARARASSPITAPTLENRVRLKDAAIERDTGKPVGHLRLPSASSAQPD